jgi:conjugative relaxase-like TrwC/TraI family protein
LVVSGYAAAGAFACAAAMILKLGWSGLARRVAACRSAPRPDVLSIGKLGRGAEGYYLNAVAKGVEDYYLGSGEALGRWVGSGSARLGLSGVVDGDDLRAVLDGRRPVDGRSLLWQRREDRLPGFDLTFSAPKGVSLLFALSHTRTSLLVREAHDRAVAAALGYLEREAGEVRRGKDGVDRLPGGGFVAAAFRHRTSRAGDPQLHTQVLVANMSRGQDGRWSALDGRQLYWQAKTAGTLYQTALRHELRALGLRFTLRENGLSELADVPRSVLRAFSRRRVEIEAELARRGDSSRAAAQVATLATRKAKDYGVPAESLAAEWHSRAEGLGFDAAHFQRLARDAGLPPIRLHDLRHGAASLALAGGGPQDGVGDARALDHHDHRGHLRDRLVRCCPPCRRVRGTPGAARAIDRSSTARSHFGPIWARN